MLKPLRSPLLTAAALLVLPAVAQQSTKPVVTITTMPPKDAGGPEKMAVIAGNVQAAPRDSRIVIFAHGDVWYVQPYAASPYTKIQDGKFQTDTHLGTQYAVLVVRPAYKPPASTGDLPDEGGDVIAIKIVAGR